MTRVVRNPALLLPPRSEFGRELTNLEGRLRTAALGGFSAIFERNFFVRMRGERRSRGHIGRNDALEELKLEVDQLGQALRQYIAAWIDPRISEQVFEALPFALDPTGRTVNAARLAIRRGIAEAPHLLARASDVLEGRLQFSGLIGRRLFGKTASDVDRFEASKVPKIGYPAFANESMMKDAQRMYQLWFLLVRLCLATVIVQALPYREIWNGVYGDAGYWLSTQVPQLAGSILSSRAYGEVEAARGANRWVDDYVSFGGMTGSLVAFPLGRTLSRLAEETRGWRERCRLQACEPSQHGQAYPYEFSEIPPELRREPAYTGSLPDHMFARARARQRVEQVRTHWIWLKCNVLKLGDEAMSFGINAGSLEHGGAHPPHKTHRNGAMFDLDLGKPGDDRRKAEFPHPICPVPMHIASTEPVIRPESARDNPTIVQTMGKLLEAVGEIFFILEEPEEAPEEPARREVFRFCARDFEFPGGGVENEEGKQVPYAEIALRFTQAMLLTFPSQIVYARWATLSEAQADLGSRVDAARAELGKDGKITGGEEDRALGFMKTAFRKPPAQAPTDGSFRPLFQRDDHFTHWHLSYLPDDLENASTDRDTTLDWIEKHPGLLWRGAPGHATHDRAGRDTE